ncbi:MAG: response regulator [Desulfobacterales bacterium]|nr:MAG: response regulator [Desulfobacterales bacterium]
MGTILVIDDEKGIVDLIQEALSQFGHDVETAINGIEGIHKFEHGRFDMVITDMRMPGMDGNGVVRHIRSSLRQSTPIIGISGTPWLFQETGFDMILPKPFPLKTLVDSVDHLSKPSTAAAAESERDLPFN